MVENQGGAEMTETMFIPNDRPRIQWESDDHLRFKKDVNGDLCVHVPLGGDNPNLVRVYRIDKKDAQKLAVYLREAICDII